MADESITYPIKDPIKHSINNYYDNLTYRQEYMYDIWITIIIFFIVLFFVMYFYIKNTILSQKTTWNINKCNPLYMPFASLINPEITDPDYNFKNFKECSNSLNFSLLPNFSKPIDTILAFFSSTLTLASGIANTVMNYIVFLINLIIQLFLEIIQRILRIIDEGNLIYIAINNSIQQVLSFFTVIYYKLILIVTALKFIFTIFALAILLGVIVPLIVACIICFVLSIVFFALAFIPFVGGVFAAVASSLIAITLILVALIILLYMLYNKFLAISEENNSDTQPYTNTQGDIDPQETSTDTGARLAMDNPAR